MRIPHFIVSRRYRYTLLIFAGGGRAQPGLCLTLHTITRASRQPLEELGLCLHLPEAGGNVRRADLRGKN